jgi:hypothetical protein
MIMIIIMLMKLIYQYYNLKDDYEREIIFLIEVIFN